MTKEQSREKIEYIINNRSELGVVIINGFYFSVWDWSFKFLRDGILIRSTCPDTKDYRSLYITFEDVNEIR